MCRVAVRIAEVFLQFALSKVRKVTHLMRVNPRLAISENQLTIAITVFRNAFDGMQVAN